MGKRMLLFGVLVLVLGSVSAAQGAVLLDKVMAIVNKEVITWSDVYRGMEYEAADEIKALKAEERRRLFKENEMGYLELLIDMRLQLQEAARAGVSASKEDVERAIRSIKEKYSLSDEAFAEMIRKEGFSLDAYKKRLAEQITLSRIVDQEVRGKVLVTEREIDTYLAENKNEARENEGFSVSHLFLRKAEDKRQVEEKMEEILKQIKAGGDFADLARQYSEDASARSGGDLGFIRKSDMSPGFLAVLSGMKAGQVSEPFWGENGLHLLKLNGIRKFDTPQELREAVRQKLLDAKLSRELRNWVKGLREKAYVEIKI
ncbi:MAG: peptidylprolyl isomerase [Alphaproteobacteria bacterium]|uniref:Peptidylprolyl isomerase n=1 Tax=Candidatus Nitrobium versatile TaxID=2884831 RepID=A0A953JEQ8_9BACT|nr:peptidylprolyl isomerase [Candidatus Nitrobium versatile]